MEILEDGGHRSCRRVVDPCQVCEPDLLLLTLQCNHHRWRINDGWRSVQQPLSV